MQDANCDLAVTAIRASRIINSGQVCNCAERAYVYESIAESFVRKMMEAMKATKVDDPFAPGTEMGPMGAVSTV
jgi:lactaldehyde dehydrogenase/glycolaldehyde dehydrogenase